MKVLVTGGAGYIGSVTTRAALAEGHAVTVLDDLSSGHRRAIEACQRPGEVDVEFVVGSILDDDVLADVMRPGRFDAVMHFAARSIVAESYDDPYAYYATNVVGGLKFLEAARKGGVNRFVFSSTAAIFGPCSADYITEDDAREPLSPYGSTKLAFERMLESYRHAYGLGYACLRYFNAAGATADHALGEDHCPETHLIPLVLRAADGEKPLEVFGGDYPTPDGTCIRDFIHVEDLASAHMLALDALEGGAKLVYNLGSENGHSVLEVIRTASEVIGRAIPYQIAARRPGDVPRLVAGSERIRRELGWKRRWTELADIIESAWRWHEEHPHGYRD